MQLLRPCDVNEVRANWLAQAPQDVNHINRLIDPSMRDDFPRKATWYLALIESTDIDSIFLISIGDFGALSNHSWRLSQATDNMNIPAYELHHDPHARKVRALATQNCDDFWPVMVATSLAGPYTIIDGNHRAIARHQHNQLIGSECYLAMHADFNRYAFATQANRWRDQQS